MCLAEALLRIPDADTVDRLIRDKIAGADWERHLGKSDSLFVNASTWALMLTGRVVKEEPERDLRSMLRRLVTRSGEPVGRRRAPRRGAAPPPPPRGGAGGAPGRDASDAHPRPPIRHGADHRGSARA